MRHAELHFFNSFKISANVCNIYAFILMQAFTLSADECFCHLLTFPHGSHIYWQTAVALIWISAAQVPKDCISERLT